MAPEALSEDDFRLLGLKPGSKPSEVRRAYRTLVKKWHPDHHHSEPYESRAFAEMKFREIDEAYRRISESWGKTPRQARASARAYPWAGLRGARRSGTKAQAARAAPSRPKIAVLPFSRAKLVLPALLLAAAVFILTQFPSVFQDTAVDTQTPRPRTVEHPPGVEAPNSQGPSEEAGKQFSADLMAPSSPVLPPALLEPQPTPPSGFFTLGSTISEVLGIQGTPSRIQGQTWTYGLSEIHFRNGRVLGFNNFDGSLRVRMQPSAPQDGAPPDHIAIGSSEQEVLLVQGTPTRVEGNRWFYGFAELLFKDGRVVEYDNYFGTLKMRILPSAPTGPEPSRNFFTIGSTPDEVLAVQGTPTAIHGTRWTFDFAIVFFRDGKVHSVTNPQGTLRFIAP